MHVKSGAIATLVAIGLLVSSCSSGSGQAAPSTTAPSTVASTTASVSIPSSGVPSSGVPSSGAPSSSVLSSSVPSSNVRTSSAASATPTLPRRIVSLSPSATEDLFAIGAGSQVVAVDSDSNYPTSVPKTSLSAFQPNVESIARYKPDLVVISDDINNIKAQLAKLSIPVLVEPAATSLEDTYQQIQALGVATGHTVEAKSTVAGMRSSIAALVATVPRRAVQLTYFHELDNTLYTVSPKTFVGQIYALAGLKDVADPATTKGAAYPQLSAEYLVKSDPDLVFLADTKCCQQNAATFAARPGFSVLSAVKNKQVVSLDDDVASRWGPRVVELLRKIIDAVKSVRSS